MGGRIARRSTTRRDGRSVRRNPLARATINVTGRSKNNLEQTTLNTKSKTIAAKRMTSVCFLRRNPPPPPVTSDRKKLCKNTSRHIPPTDGLLIRESKIAFFFPPLSIFRLYFEISPALLVRAFNVRCGAVRCGWSDVKFTGFDVSPVDTYYCAAYIFYANRSRVVCWFYSVIHPSTRLPRIARNCSLVRARYRRLDI